MCEAGSGCSSWHQPISGLHVVQNGLEAAGWRARGLQAPCGVNDIIEAIQLLAKRAAAVGV
jgi:hypothetical protein